MQSKGQTKLEAVFSQDVVSSKKETSGMMEVSDLEPEEEKEPRERKNKMRMVQTKMAEMRIVQTKMAEMRRVQEEEQAIEGEQEESQYRDCNRVDQKQRKTSLTKILLDIIYNYHQQYKKCLLHPTTPTKLQTQFPFLIPRKDLLAVYSRQIDDKCGKKHNRKGRIKRFNEILQVLVVLNIIVMDKQTVMMVRDDREEIRQRLPRSLWQQLEAIDVRKQYKLRCLQLRRKREQFRQQTLKRYLLNLHIKANKAAFENHSSQQKLEFPLSVLIPRSRRPIHLAFDKMSEQGKSKSKRGNSQEELIQIRGKFQITDIPELLGYLYTKEMSTL